MAVEEAKPRHLELPDYIRILSKRKWFVLIVTGVTALFGGLYALSSERVYEATARVLIRQRPQGFFWVTGEEAPMAPDVAMETYAVIARSAEVTNRASDRLAELPPESRISVSGPQIQRTLKITVIKPDLLLIDATSPDERKARYFANYVAQAFVEVNTEDRQTESRIAREFLEQQVDEYQQQLQSVINDMAQVARQSGMLDVESEVTSVLSDTHTYQNQMRQAETDLASAQARLAELEATRARETPAQVRTQPVPNPARAQIGDRLTAARIELQTLMSQYTESHPRVLNARATLQQLQREYNDTPQVIDAQVVSPNSAVGAIDAEIKEARLGIDEIRARIGTISGTILSLQHEMQGLPEQRQQWQALLDRADAARQAYNALSEQLRQARLAEAIKQGNARVVDTAQVPRMIQASFFRSFLFAGALGLFIGLALAIVLEALDDTIYSVEDLQRVTDLYLLGVLPLRTDEAGSLVTITAPKSPPAEAYRTLRSNIRFSLFDQPAHTFMVTSAGTGEGKSVTAANLAISYAQSGDSVILADADLRRPIMHRLFNVTNNVGITNVLVGDATIEDALIETEVPGLRLLPSGPLPPNPAELLESDRMAELLQGLTDHADLVIFDSPPAVMLTDAGILSSKLDRTIIVAESGHVTERAIRDLERLFRHARADVLGIVLNKLRVTGGDYYYYYYYDYVDHSGAAEGEGNVLSAEAANGVTLGNGRRSRNEDERSDSGTDQPGV